MTAPRFAAQLNEQIGNEFAAHQQYVACAIHYDALTMPQMAAFLQQDMFEAASMDQSVAGMAAVLDH